MPPPPKEKRYLVHFLAVAAVAGIATLNLDNGLSGYFGNRSIDFTMEGTDQGYMVTGITTNVEYTMKEKIQQAGMNTLLGMGTTFAILILLALVIALFGKVVGDASNRTSRKTVVQETAAPVAAIPEEDTEELVDDTELVAVIAAAIAAFEGAQSVDGFVVRSIRKARRK